MKLLVVSEVARRLSCSTTQVYRLLKEEFMEEFVTGRRHFVKEESVNEFIETHTHDGFLDSSLSYARLLRDNPDMRT